jgi:hypothetical protein
LSTCHFVPFGKWSDDPNLKRIGSFYEFQMQSALEGYTLRLFTKTLGWSKEDTDALINRVQEELQQKDLRLYSYFHLVIGRSRHKPLESNRGEGGSRKRRKKRNKYNVMRPD